jgi:hypothetical protein
MAAPTQIGISRIHADREQPGMTRFIGFLVSAGLINASIAAILLCNLPDDHFPSLAALFARASIYVVVASLAGLLGARFYWNRSSTPSNSDPPLSFSLFALANAAGWVWVPAVVILSTQDSLASPALAVLGAAILATGLRKIIPPVSIPPRPPWSAAEWPEGELFADTLRTEPREFHGYVIAVCIYIAAYDIHDQWNLWAAGLLALCAFLIVWKLSRDANPSAQSRNKGARAATRLALISLPAILVTLFALMFGVASRNRAEAARLAATDGASKGGGSNEKPTRPAGNPASGISGYESIILWPVSEKKQIVPPLPAESSFLAPGTTKPLVIRFDAPYWYFQPPSKRPGPRAYQAHGTPLVANIEANNFIPLIMEAHQNLGSFIRIDRCREIKVSILNRDNRRGVLNLAVLLTDTASPAQTYLYLGQQPVVTSQTGAFTVKSAPAAEVLRFPVPVQAKIRKFDEITVMFLPDDANFEIGPKIAIQDFELLPR